MVTEQASTPGATSTASTLTLEFGPISIEPGGERTQCVQKRLGNSEAIKVGKIHNQLFGVSHHFILYRVNDTVERLEPYDCESITEVVDPEKAAALAITQRQDDLLEFPDGTAVVLGPNQMVRLEVHYINPTDRDAMVDARSTFYTLPDEQFEHEVGFLFAGALDIDVAPGAASSLTTFIRPPIELAGRQFFAFTGHAHRMGTNVRVAMGHSSSDAMETVYDVPGYDWSAATTVYHTPPRVMPQPGGFQLTCDWQNTSDRRILFGTSAENEMCAFWAYYYPSVGSRACLKGKATGDISLCCPGRPSCK